MNGPTLLRRTLRAVIASTVLGGLLAAGLATPAAAAETHSLTVNVSNVTGTPLTGLAVYAIAMADGAEIPGTRAANGDWVKATAVKGKKGVYSFTGLGDTDHTLYFGTSTTTTFTQLLGGESDLERAQLVPASQTSLTVSLASNAVITGVVKSAAGKVLKKAYVTAHYFTGTEWIAYSTVRSDAKGKYTLRDLDPGSYRLEFSGAATEYSRLYSGGASTFDSATAIAVGVGTTTAVNAAFPKAVGAITGRAFVEYSGYEEYGSFPLERARAVAYPVLVDRKYYGDAPVLDLEHGIASAFTGKKGTWAIKNLVPGKYVVKLYPNYYNQTGDYLGTSDLQYTYILTVVAGATTKAPVSLRSLQTDEGGALSVEVISSLGQPIAGADVLLQNVADPEYYYFAKTAGNGTVNFGKSGKHRTIQPGKFTLSINAHGEWMPYSAPIDVRALSAGRTIYLYPSTAPAGFVAPPSIAQTDLTVGTRYDVVAQPNRTTSALRYQWLRDGHPIYGANEANYTSRTGDIGTQISARVTSSQFGYPDDSATAAVAGIITSSAVVPTNVTAPSITPSANAWVGTTLHVLPGTWSVAGLDFDYEWFRDGVPFANDGESYDVTLADLGAEFTATVTAHKTGHPDATASTPAGVTPVPAPATEPRVAPTVSNSTKGLAKGSVKYTVAPGTWTSRAPVFSYSWLRGGVEVGTGPTYIEKTTKTELAKTLEVVVSATGAGFEPGSAVAIARRASAALVVSTAPTVTLASTVVAAGSPVANGQVLTASTGTWIHGIDDAGTLNYGYQWIRKVGKAKPVAIPGATKSTYLLTATDVGAVLSVTVTANSTRWAKASTTVAAGTGVGKPGLGATQPVLLIGGSTLVGSSLYQATSAAWPVVTKQSYQWFACIAPACTDDSPLAAFTKIAKATTSYFKPTAAFTNVRVYLVISTTAVGWADVVQRSNVLRVVAADSLPLLTRPKIANTGIQIQATAGADRATYGATLTIPYVREWQVCLANCLSETATWAPATGAQNSSGQIVPTAANWGTGESYLRVKETGTRDAVTVVSISDPVPFVMGKISERLNSLPFIPSSFTGTYGIVPRSLPAYLTYTQRWFVEGEERSTAATFTRTAEDAGKRIYAIITVSGVGFDDYEYTMLAPGSAVFTPTVSPTEIVGAKFGETLSLTDPQPFDDLPQYEHTTWTYSYSWDALAPSTSGTYVPVASRIGKISTVRISVTSPLYGTYMATVSTPSALLAGEPLTVSSDAALEWSGDLLPATTVTAAPPGYSATDVVSTFAWQTSIDGGTTWVTETTAKASTFTPGLIHADRMLRAIVTGTKAGNGTVVSTTAPVHILEGDVIRVLGVPVLSGVARVGSPLTTTFGAWSEGASIRTEWLLNGRVIPGANGKTYVPLATHAGDEISVRVTGSQAGKLDVVAESAALSIARGTAPVTSKAPTIAGTTTLTATPGVWNVSGLTFAFEWSRNGEVVATGSTLAVPAGTVRADYTLTIRATRFGYEPGLVTLAG